MFVKKFPTQCFHEAYRTNQSAQVKQAGTASNDLLKCKLAI